MDLRRSMQNCRSLFPFIRLLLLVGKCAVPQKHTFDKERIEPENSLHACFVPLRDKHVTLSANRGTRMYYAASSLKTGGFGYPPRWLTYPPPYACRLMTTGSIMKACSAAREVFKEPARITVTVTQCQLRPEYNSLSRKMTGSQ